jgi:DNA-binding XRE family transcriptional regulator
MSSEVKKSPQGADRGILEGSRSGFSERRSQHGTIPRMPNIASNLKSEITRIARKEIRAEVGGLKKSVGAYRSEIAALKRRAQSLEQHVKRLERSTPKPGPMPAVETDKALPFSAKGLAKQRRRLALSADAVGLLVGASGQSIYNWEAGKARPRANHLAAVAALRSLSKTQAAEVLAARKVAK